MQVIHSITWKNEPSTCPTALFLTTALDHILLLTRIELLDKVGLRRPMLEVVEVILLYIMQMRVPLTPHEPRRPVDILVYTTALCGAPVEDAVWTLP